MSTAGLWPDFDTFCALSATHRVVPVTRRLLADEETPVGVYRKLAAGRAGTFLLESAEHGRAWSRYSFIGARSLAMLTERAGRAHWVGEPGIVAAKVSDDDPLETLRGVIDWLRSPPLPNMPPLTGGFVGYLGYDVVRRLEKLPELARDDLRLPELAMMLATDLAVVDHADGSILLIANVIFGDTHRSEQQAYDAAVARLDEMTEALRRPAEPHVAVLGEPARMTYTSNTEAGEFVEKVERAKEYIRAGDAFQVVLSQRFECDTRADPLDVYRVLRTTNPSPYMYLLHFGGFHVVGSSPEALVKVVDGRALMHPIAGTRPRGATPEDDSRLAEELRSDPKERAEHVMLVDLGRNDLGRVCGPGSVDVVDFMSVERYSHVMHLVSTVVGDLSPGKSAFDVLTACFPAGTLSGAPKPRAMEIIEELEPTRRAVYGGAVGYLDFAGDCDTAVTIRTAVLRGGRAYVQAGAGIVADSDPHREDKESRDKAAVVLAAIATAESMKDAS